jgi:hypothetical protein
MGSRKQQLEVASSVESFDGASLRPADELPKRSAVEIFRNPADGPSWENTTRASTCDDGDFALGTVHLRAPR